MLVILVIAAGLAFAVIMLYNGLIRKKNAVDNAYYSMDVQLRKRYDLIPQLVETVKGYMQHEKDLLTQLTTLRQQVLDNNLNTNDKVGLDNAIGDVLKQVVVQVENYPDLKASQNFLHLQRSINETEEQLAASRRFFNAAVADYHNGIEQFPSNLIASWAHMKHRNFFTISEEQKQVPSVKLN